MSGRAALALLLACGAIAGCGGGGASTADEPTPTATATASATATGTPGPEGIDVDAVNEGRDTFVAICAEREANADVDRVAELRRAASPLLVALSANPRERFRRSPGVPATTMLQRVQALASLARTTCGGGRARAVGDRLGRAVVRSSR